MTAVGRSDELNDTVAIQNKWRQRQDEVTIDLHTLHLVTRFTSYHLIVTTIERRLEETRCV